MSDPVLTLDEIDRQLTGWEAQVARVKAADVDLIFAASLTRETVGIAAEVKKLGWSGVKLLTAIPGRTMVVAQLGKDAVEGLYGIGSWNIFTPGNEPADVKAWNENYKKRFNLDPDENALLAYAYTDWLVKYGLEPAGRDITLDKVVKALQSSSFSHPVFYGPERFVNQHINPETTQVSQIKSVIWVPVSDLLNPK